VLWHGSLVTFAYITLLVSDHIPYRIVFDQSSLESVSQESHPHDCPGRKCFGRSPIKIQHNHNTTNTTQKAGGMLLPTFVGHDEIWCGGQGVTMESKETIVGQGVSAVTVFQYSYDALTAHSDPCSFQGDPHEHRPCPPVDFPRPPLGFRQ